MRLVNAGLGRVNRTPIPFFIGAQHKDTCVLGIEIAGGICDQPRYRLKPRRVVAGSTVASKSGVYVHICLFSGPYTGNCDIKYLNNSGVFIVFSYIFIVFSYMG